VCWPASTVDTLDRVPATIVAEVLSGAQWRARRAAHESRVDAWITAHRDRRRVGRRHPVEDFLFTYYSSRPRQLRRWHPGAGVVLAEAEPADFGPDYASRSAGLALDTSRVRARRGDAIAWIRQVLTGTASRPPHFGCFGMHEWAMVYRQSADEVRHADWPLRLTPAETAAVVDANRVRCSHFDAFRFFTPPARSLNVLQPTRATQAALEQPGCLHANMDLYKWSYKLSPLVASELVADSFALAREIRTVDMRASPYDLSELGYAPIRVESPEGRADYIAAQREFADRAAVLRRQLIAAIDTAAAIDSSASVPELTAGCSPLGR
jgi:hypothetical protein